MRKAASQKYCSYVTTYKHRIKHTHAFRTFIALTREIFAPKKVDTEVGHEAVIYAISQQRHRSTQDTKMMIRGN